MPGVQFFLRLFLLIVMSMETIESWYPTLCILYAHACSIHLNIHMPPHPWSLVYTHLWWEGSFTKTPKCDRVVWLPPGTRRSRVPWGSQTKLSHEGVLVKLPEHLGEYMVYPMIRLHNNPQFIGVGGCLPIFYRPRWSERVVWIETTRSWACGLDFCNKSYCVVSLCRIG